MDTLFVVVLQCVAEADGIVVVGSLIVLVDGNSGTVGVEVVSSVGVAS